MKIPSRVQALFTQNCTTPKNSSEELKFKLQEMFNVRVANRMEKVKMPRIVRYTIYNVCGKTTQKIFADIKIADEIVANTFYSNDILNSFKYFERVEEWVDIEIDKINSARETCPSYIAEPYSIPPKMQVRVAKESETCD